ncbi:uncharacterized protein Bfra_000806 [Botrytis fragariae]|uniref:Uncharacterized protein n=1 Tax=Botrytis fragariae TaxID=1964551 RepID=A0A8H6ENH9_9HELO|nr:uncharacterized protein Bfra_000806 [Botrytis fragariae]KAF5878639.1 hypothetical protein Bfra_000806 [Botrytis fragariae]
MIRRRYVLSADQCLIEADLLQCEVEEGEPRCLRCIKYDRSCNPKEVSSRIKNRRPRSPNHQTLPLTPSNHNQSPSQSYHDEFLTHNFYPSPDSDVIPQDSLMDYDNQLEDTWQLPHHIDTVAGANKVYLSLDSNILLQNWFASNDNQLENTRQLPNTTADEGIGIQDDQRAVSRRPAPEAVHLLYSMEPSNIILKDRIIAQIHRRLLNLWGSEQAFLDAKKVTNLMARKISNFFGRDAPQMALSYPMIREAYYACGAADALRNFKLHNHVREEYQTAYQRHNDNAIAMINAAIDDVLAGTLTDLWPLYHAIFLSHASAACVRGPEYIQAAKTAFKYLDDHVKEKFPFEIHFLTNTTAATEKSKRGNWTVRMRLAKHLDDPGMELSRSNFLLGEARVKYDKEVGAS